MKSIIICEGSTDGVLLQYFMRQDIIRGVKWEDYIDIQGEFHKLSYLNEE